MLRFNALGLFGLALLCGCASGRQGQVTNVVTDQMLARVPRDEMTEVYEQRTWVGRARDEVAREELEGRKADNEVALAQQEVEAANAQLDRAEQAARNAAFNRDIRAQQQAREDREVYRLAKAAAQAHLRAARERVDEGRAALLVARERVSVVQAALERREYQALLRSGDPVSQRVDVSELRRQAELLQRQLRDAEAALWTERWEHQRAREQYEDALRDYHRREATGGSGAGQAFNGVDPN